MTDMTPIAVRLTTERVKTMLEAAGAQNVSVKDVPRRPGLIREAGMWAFFSYFGKRFVWGIRAGAYERNFARDVATELGAANSRPL